MQQSPRKYDLRLDVTDKMPALSAKIAMPVVIGVSVFVPEILPAEAQIMFCLPGGGYSKAYFDRQIAGHAAYSFADFMRGQNIVVVTLDHLGLGSSSQPLSADCLTPLVLAEAHHWAVLEIVRRLEDGAVFPQGLKSMQKIGVAHSMGGFIAVEQQGAFQTYDALAILGWQTLTRAGKFADLGAPSVPSAQEDSFAQLNWPQRNSYVFPPRQDFRKVFYLPDVPEAVIEADQAEIVASLAPVMRALFAPEAGWAAAARIDVPIF